MNGEWLKHPDIDHCVLHLFFFFIIHFYVVYQVKKTQRCLAKF